MKIIPTTTAAITMACLAIDVSAHRSYQPPALVDGKPPLDASGEPRNAKSVAHFKDKPVKMELCPSGDCAKQKIALSLARLDEVDDQGKSVSNAAEKITEADYMWGALETDDFDSVPAMTTHYAAMLDVGANGASGTAEFNVTSSIFERSGSVVNANQTLAVPSGALKFTVSMASWPFKDASHSLRLGMKVAAWTKDGKPVNNAGTLAAVEDEDNLNRLSLGEGMFMDVPLLASIDGEDKVITSSWDAAKMELTWEFPHFENDLLYDPVVGSTDPSAVPPKATSTSGSKTGTGSGSGNTGTGGTGTGGTGGTGTGGTGTGGTGTGGTGTGGTGTGGTGTGGTGTGGSGTANTQTGKSAASGSALTTVLAGVAAALAVFFY